MRWVQCGRVRGYLGHANSLDRTLRARLANGGIEMQYCHAFFSMSVADFTPADLELYFSAALDGDDLGMRSYHYAEADCHTEFFVWRAYEPNGEEIALAELALDSA